MKGDAFRLRWAHRWIGSIDLIDFIAFSLMLKILSIEKVTSAFASNKFVP
jgi:hypothetical protein